jgi:hypothetical protein
MFSSRAIVKLNRNVAFFLHNVHNRARICKGNQFDSNHVNEISNHLIFKSAVDFQRLDSHKIRNFFFFYTMSNFVQDFR